MPVNGDESANELLQAVVAWLQATLPPTWEADVTKRSDMQTPDLGADGAIDLRANNGVSNTLLVEAKRSFSPRDVDRLLGGMTRAYRKAYPNMPLLLVAPWLSPQSQERLRSEDVNYFDLTGNVWIQLENPTLLLSTQGARKDPDPPQASKLTIRGPKSGRLIRWLVDIQPPYGVRELAEASGLSASYVSRMLDTLDEDALIERDRRGRVESVALVSLLRRWADTYSLLKSNTPSRYIARNGAEDIIETLRTVPERTAVTGSFAAVRRAPVAAPALLAVYTDSPADVASALDLLPADQGVNILLLKPYDPVVWDRTTTDNGITYVADSQAVADCLTGTGRMPAEGEALLEWMTANESAWRLESLTDSPADR